MKLLYRLSVAAGLYAAAVLAQQEVSISIDLTSYLNNRAFGQFPGDANFDGSGGSMPAQYLPSSPFVLHGISYDIPTYSSGSANDNVQAASQTISIPSGGYQSLYMLAASYPHTFALTHDITAQYSDGTASTATVLVHEAWGQYPGGGDVLFPYHFEGGAVDWNRSALYEVVAWVNSSKVLTSLQLPGESASNALHIVALSAVPIADNGTAEGVAVLEVQYARSTKRWVEGLESEEVQVVDVVVNNIGKEWITGPDYVNVQVISDGVDTVTPGIIKRLRSGDQARVEVGVKNKAGVGAGSIGDATVVLSGPAGLSVNYTFNATFGIGPYEETWESVYSHESPGWYNGAKYGIFIHWGVYSVPGWGNTGSRENYAEWYWLNLNNGPNDNTQTYQYHLATYGENVVYDDFIQNFTADAWDPQEWVDLFADAGATYFVQVSKHHEGFALFDLPANVSQRTSVVLGPKRNLLQELFDAAKTYQPQLHRAAYLSLPEWYNPDYKKYGFWLWPGGNASNPYTGQTLPYTGYVHVEDYLQDLILPEMNILADMGTEIMWCDVGGPNVTVEFASAWFNAALQDHRSVTMDNRCGLPGDFDTPEYARYAAATSRKWESNLGMDPFSYGYNRATPLSSYMNATTIINSLVDIVSKNGNFLLDVGPTANGTIIQTEQDNLREAGVWIKSHGEAIFNTTWWFVTPQEGDNIRFTTTQDAFYIFSLVQPSGSIELASPVPWVNGDNVTVVGGGMDGTVVPSSLGANGILAIEISSEVANADDMAWVFKISF